MNLSMYPISTYVFESILFKRNIKVYFLIAYFIGFASCLVLVILTERLKLFHKLPAFYYITKLKSQKHTIHLSHAML